MQKPGAVVFDNLSLMFAIGIGFGLSEDFRGEAALAAAVAFLGLQAMTGQGALAELFYGHVMTYNSDAIHNQIDPIISALNNSSTSGTANILNLDGPVRATLDDGQIIDYQGLIGDKGYFDGLSQLLYFVKGTNIISATDELGNAGYVIAPNVIYMLDVGVLGGIVAGGTVAVLYNNFREIKIPEALSFFGGRRFIPMLAIASV